MWLYPPNSWTGQKSSATMEPPSFSEPAVPRPAHQGTPASSAACLLRRLSRPRYATPVLAACCGGRPPRRAGDAARTAREQRPPAQAGQRRAVAAAGKNAFYTSYPSDVQMLGPRLIACDGKTQEPREAHARRRQMPRSEIRSSNKPSIRTRFSAAMRCCSQPWTNWCPQSWPW